MITNVKNSYMALPTVERLLAITQIDNLLDCKSPCKKADVDLLDEKWNTVYISLTVKTATAGTTLKLQIPITDIVYTTSSEDLQYSIDDFNDWIASGIRTAGTYVERGLGRQFLLNTYLVFNWNKTQQKHVTIGQLKDLGKITNTERLWLMIFGVTIVGLILLVLIIKLACKKKEDTNELSNSDYLKHES